MTPGQAAATAAVYAQLGSVSTEELRDELGLGSVDQKQREQDLRAHSVLRELMERVPVGIRIGGWNIASGTISFRLGDFRLSDHEVRGRVMLLAEQFGLDYAEYPTGGAKSQNRVSATGNYEGVSVGISQVVAPCNCENCEAVQ